MLRNPLLAGLKATHPGEILRRDVLPSLDMPRALVAKTLGISRQMLYDILSEKKAVTPEMALRLSRFLSTSPEMWINLQRDYDLKTMPKKVTIKIMAIRPAVPAQ